MAQDVQHSLRIGELSRRVGVSPELLRAWERRYGLLHPARKTQENDLMSRYTDDYPPLKEVRRQRELAEKALVELPRKEIAAAGESGSDDAKKAAVDRLDQS